MDQNPTPAPEAPVAEPVQPVAPEQTEKKGGKGLAIAALICGIAGLVLCWVPFLGLILAIVGVVLGIIALVKKSNKGMSIAGLICGAVGLIPAALISLAIGGLASLVGGTVSEFEEYTADPIGFCKKNPSSVYCDEEEPKNHETCAENLDGDDCEYGSDEYWEAYCVENPDSIFCEEDDNGDDDYGWVDKYVEEYMEENATEEDLNDPKYDTVKDTMTDALKDFVICANDNGLNIKSSTELEEVMGGDTDFDELGLTTSQQENLEECLLNYTMVVFSLLDESEE